MAVMYVWTAEWGKMSLGHASLLLSDNSAYISWWPTGDKSKNCMKKKSEGKTKECVPDDYEVDRDFLGRKYTHRFYIWISAKGVENIRKWWMNIKDKGGYNLLFNNCCDAVVQALRKGGIEIEMSLFRKPGDMVGLGNDLEQDTTGWAGTDSTSLLNVIAKLEMNTRNLESELHTVEKVQDKYSMP